MTQRPIPWFAAVLAAALCAAPASAAPPVANTNDAGVGSLRAALAAAAPGDTITVPPGTYAVGSGELLVANNVTLIGAGATTTIIDAGHLSRILHATAGALTVSGITFMNGASAGGSGANQGGGAIRVDSGALTVSDSAFTNNAMTAGPLSTGQSGGGAIWANGSLVVTGSSFSGNTASVNGGSSNGGGAIFLPNLNPASLTNDQFSSDSFTQLNGSANQGGGGLFTSGAITLSGTSFTNEKVTIDADSGNSGGGAFYSGGSGVTMTNSSLNGNSVTFNTSVNSSGGGGFYDDGGGDTVSITASTIANNTVTLTPPTMTDSGGGGFFSGARRIVLRNSTISFNTVNATGGPLSNGGGALYNFGGSGEVTNTTIAQNSSTFLAGGLFENGSATFALKNSIVARNTAPSGANCGGTAPVSQGNNIEDVNSCSLTQPTDQTGVDPLLGPLAANDGPTWTQALLAGSPAIDRGDSASCPATDQRGVPRPQGPACDIGAFELKPSVAAPSSPPVTAPPPAQKLAAVTFSALVTLPSAKKCVSRRAFRIRLRVPKGLGVNSAEVRVNGKRVKTVKRSRITAPVDLRNLPKGRFTVTIRVKLADGRTITGKRKYRTCTVKQRSKAKAKV